MGRWSVGWPLFLTVVGIGAAIRHLWIPAAIAILLAAFAVWLIAMYER
jgi:hypothetical protein